MIMRTKKASGPKLTRHEAMMSIGNLFRGSRMQLTLEDLSHFTF